MYAAKWGLTQSQALEEMSRSHIHGSAAICTFARDLLSNENVPIDKRAGKDCFGFKCRCCNYSLQCRVGIYKDGWVVADCYKHLLIKSEDEE